MSSHKYSFKEWFGDEIERSSTIQIRHLKKEVDRLAGNKKVRYYVWIEDVDDHDPGPMKQLVDAG